MSLSITSSGVGFGLRAMKQAEKQLTTSLERLATGKKLNRASDDPSGLVVSEDFAAQQRQIEKKLEGLGREQLRLSASDGAHGVVNDLLIELNATVVSAANRDALSKDEVDALQLDADSIVQTINFLSGSTRYNGDLVLRGSSASQLGQRQASVHHESGETEIVSYSIQSLASGGALNFATGDLEKAQDVVNAALEGSSGQRAAYGARSKAIDSEISDLQIELENITAARSQITDTDYAAETANLVRAQVLQSAAQFSVQLAQKQNSDLILKLLK